DGITFVPMSGLIGDNLKDPSPNTPWYKGDTVLQAFDKFTVPPKETGKDLRIPVQDVYKIKGAGTVPVGRVETGIIKVGDKVVFMPSGVTAEVRSIEMHHEAMKSAQAGDNIGFNLRGVEAKLINRGDVVGHEGKAPNVASIENLLVTQAIVIWHPTAVSVNYTPITHLHTAQVAMRFAELPPGKDFLKKNDAGVIKLQPMKKVCVEKFSDYAPLGRLAVRDMGRTVAVGIVKDIIKA
ncbi:MAG: elongation factor 1-alpha C-terminal domain-related protein, partial [Promethearchaeota archaeon]